MQPAARLSQDPPSVSVPFCDGIIDREARVDWRGCDEPVAAPRRPLCLNLLPEPAA